MALVAEDGREFYEVVDFKGLVEQWVWDNVMPILGKPAISQSDFYSRLFAFLDQFDNPVIVADHPADIGYFAEAVITDSVGSRYCRPWSARCMTDVEYKSAIPHNALEDARAICRAMLAARPASSPASNAEVVAWREYQGKHGDYLYREAREHLPHPEIAEPLYAAPPPVQASPAKDEWMDIASAPKRGESFLVWCAERQNCYVVWRSDKESGCELFFHFGGGPQLALTETPTHWMPLPLPPKEPT